MLEPRVLSSSSCPRRWLRGSPLGAGSFGTVSLAFNLDDRSLFAVKSAPYSPSPQLLSLQNEHRILGSLNSPHIVRCLGADVAFCGNFPWLNLFLEYMQGGSIADLIKVSGGRIDETLARAYTRAILEGLCYLHKQGVVHSDIKGQNILLGAGGEAKIADFGAAKRITLQNEISPSLNLRGTPLWMAPEVLQGVEQGTPADIWSLGCTLVEMLQGRPPWGCSKENLTGSDMASLLIKIARTHENPPLVDISLSTEAKDFLDKCFQRDPNERFTAEQLLTHPFVMIKEIGARNRIARQPSPRSTLDFYEEISDGESEPELEWKTPRGYMAFMDCVPATEVYFDGGQQRREGIYENVVDISGSTWITVRCVAGGCYEEERQQPFFGEREVMVRKASEVNLETLSFLANRARAVVR